jgi:hypothetical protein
MAVPKLPPPITAIFFPINIKLNVVRSSRENKTKISAINLPVGLFNVQIK